jgi:hypothetical protein
LHPAFPELGTPPGLLAVEPTAPQNAWPVARSVVCCASLAEQDRAAGQLPANKVRLLLGSGGWLPPFGIRVLDELGSRPGSDVLRKLQLQVDAAVADCTAVMGLTQ